jgi:hypothetical protein
VALIFPSEWFVPTYVVQHAQALKIALENYDRLLQTHEFKFDRKSYGKIIIRDRTEHVWQLSIFSSTIKTRDTFLAAVTG